MKQESSLGGEMLDESQKISLTENQYKVIKDKYLRDTPTVEKWLYGVAHNIALAEILYNLDMAPEVLDGVYYKKENNRLLFQSETSNITERRGNFLKLVANLEKTYNNSPRVKVLVDQQAAVFYSLMSTWRFLPNTPTLMNAGRELQQLSACYVVPVPDSLEGINKAVSAQSFIHSSGGGTGYSFSEIRPKGDLVNSVKGVASGALAFMQVFDKMTDVIKQGGVRRGANMAVLHYTHPEIREFITAKTQSGVLENFNISVSIDSNFIQAIKTDSKYNLVNPHTNQVVGVESAKEIFDLMVSQAWKTGDPGFLVIDRINQSGSNTTPHLGQIVATNPCAELPLEQWGSCNLGSLNLSKFVAGDKIDFNNLKKDIFSCIRFLDNVIEINNYPLPEIEQVAKGSRRIGLGVMGLAEMLVKLNIPYDSSECLDFCEGLMSFINETALEASEELARERGVFPNWIGSVYDPESKYFREHRRPRNCARTALAPTGTIAITAGLQGSGIEPFFALVYTRYNAQALDSLKKGKIPEDKDVFFEVNPLFKEVAETHNYFGLTEKGLWKRIEDNHKSVRGIVEIPPEIQRLFATAHDVSIDFHVKIQAAFQKYVDNSISKTVNMSNSATEEDVREAYLLAHELGCKGITIYRDGSKSQQVLNLSSKPSKMKRPDHPFGVSSEYYQMKTGYGPLHVHINYDEKGPFQVFTNIPPLGTEIAGLTSLIGILLSKYLAEGGDPLRILKHLNSIKGDKPLGLGEKRIDSIAHAISVALREHLRKTGWLENSNAQETPISLPKVEYCSACYSPNISYEAGCSGATCHDCGFSQCS